MLKAALNKKMMTADSERIEGFAPFIDSDSEILLLGSMPSVASLAAGFYYMHPRNRLWALVARAVGRELPTLADRQESARELHLAIWDVIHACRRPGSMDSNVHDVEPADIEGLVRTHPKLRCIITNGKLAAKLLAQYSPHLELPIHNLPSTSPANAAWSVEKLAELYVPLLTAARAK